MLPRLLRRLGLAPLVQERAPGLWLRLDPGGASLDRAELGRLGEALAARALRRRGWRLLGRRLCTPAGEVDLLAREAGRLAVVEVKTGRAPLRPVLRGGRVRAAADLGRSPGRSLGPEQALRLHRAARWLGAPGPPAAVRLVEVRLVPGEGARVGEPAPVPRPGRRSYTPLP